MMLGNLNPKQGLCNGIRLSISGLHENFISAKIVSGCNPGGVVFLTRIELAPSDVNLPFVLNRRQFSLIPPYAMTIYKSQGQTFDHVGIYLDEPNFSHGQQYVALSKSMIPNHVKINTKTSEVQGKLLNNEKYFTRKVALIVKCHRPLKGLSSKPDHTMIGRGTDSYRIGMNFHRELFRYVSSAMDQPIIDIG
ncbi:hypothetical protein AVEN_179324-1 [Araneus ventricosus]|uniref:DNA helicase Pif1-like 2B domain-containing protein n=1 Tax=Araneus ventricosus TaxID=182803 RepID=A0A4Y2GXL4_ARAVE|nr:hypothetical protein AVEN_179324-1 [Araneus ventricosus]